MDGSDTRSYRTLVESELYTRQVAELEKEIARLDDILRGLLWGIALAPEIFPVVAGFSKLRLAKSREFQVPFAMPLPVIQIWFSVSESGSIELLAIEREPEDPFSAYVSAH
jgi:hypothetical protein